MHMKKFTFFIIIPFLTLNTFSYSFDFNAYVLRDFNDYRKYIYDITEETTPDNEKTFYISKQRDLLSVDLIFKKKCRPISSFNRIFIELWGRSTGMTHFIPIFKKECLFQDKNKHFDGKQEFYIPIQDSLIEPLLDETNNKSNPEIKLYMLYIGNKKRTETVFVINAFVFIEP